MTKISFKFNNYENIRKKANFQTPFFRSFFNILIIVEFKHLGKIFDWIIENYLFEKLFWFKKNDLFESNKIWSKQSIFEPNKNFCLKSDKLYFWPYTNAIICLFWRKIYLIQTNIYLSQRYFVSIKPMFNSNKSFVWIKKASETNYFHSIKYFFGFILVLVKIWSCCYFKGLNCFGFLKFLILIFFTQEKILLNEKVCYWFNHNILFLCGQQNVWLIQQNSLISQIWLTHPNIILDFNTFKVFIKFKQEIFSNQ